MLSASNTPSISPKALPPVVKDEDLPLPPPSPSSASAGFPPPPPPKITLDNLPHTPVDSGTFHNGLLSAPGSPLREAPPSPNSPSFSPGAVLGPPSPTSDVSRPKKLNPFVDLLETEKTYVDVLSGIIRKVASAWSRSNLPPPELDSMFRSVEAVFKANRSFLSKLKEIGPNPSSPRVIGDVLMKWIEQLDAPYTNYCSQYLTGFDSWDLIQSNSRLPAVLDTFSTSNPPPATGPPCWSLDALFALPRFRIKYYQKLYGRLLKNSAPGKSTDKLLIDAVGRLEKLMAIVEERSAVTLQGSNGTIETTDEVVVDMRQKDEEVPKLTSEQGMTMASERARSEETVRLQEERDVRTSFESSTRGSSLSSGQRSSRDTAATSEGRSSIGASSTPMSMPELERRLATDRCRDLFSMNPRNVRLSINSPNLPYTRELRLSEDAVIHFTPKSTGIGIIHRHGHLFLLTDLFLVCERMSNEDRAHCESKHADMWLCYPPLAAKHLRVAPLEDNGLEITILKKEVMILRVDSVAKRDFMIREFHATSNLAASLPPPSKQPPPPLPSMNGLPISLSPSGSIPPDHRPSTGASETFSRPPSANGSPRPMSPASGDPSMHRMDPHRSLSDEIVRSGFPSRSPSIQESGPSGPPPYSPSRDHSPGMPPRMGSSPGPQPGQHPNGAMAFGPGQVIPPPRSGSARTTQPSNGIGMGLPPRPGPGGPSPFGPGQIVPPSRGESMRSPPPMNSMPGRPQMGPVTGPPRSGSMGPQPYGGPGGPGPGPGPGYFSPGQRGPMAGQPPPHMHQGPPPGHFPPPGHHGPMPGQMPPQQLPPHPGPPYGNNMARTPSDPSYQGGLRKSPSTRSLNGDYDRSQPPRSAPPVPNLPAGYPQGRTNSLGLPGEEGHMRPMLPSAALPRIVSAAPAFTMEPSPPPSPTELVPSGPVESSVLANMKCKVFLKQQHQQWKSLGSAKLTLYEQRPQMIKQLVVEADNKDKTMLISTIVLTDGVERVGKTGVAIELSDNGARTGIVYMLQLRNEKSAGGLFDTLLAGSDRAGR